MGDQTGAGSSPGETFPPYFVVEFTTESGPHFALCQRMMVITPGPDSLPPSAFEALFHENVFRAVQLPPQLGKGLTQMMMLNQSGGPPDGPER